VLRNIGQHRAKSTALEQLKAKIVRLNCARLQRVLIDMDDPNTLMGESPSLFHLLKMRTRRESRMVVSEDGGHPGVNKGLRATFANYMRRKNEPIAVDSECVTDLARRARGCYRQSGRVP